MNRKQIGMLLFSGGFMMAVFYLFFGKELGFTNLIVAFQQPIEYINSIIYSIIGISVIVFGFIFLLNTEDEIKLD